MTTAVTTIEDLCPELSAFAGDAETTAALLAIVSSELPVKIAENTEKLAQFENRNQRLRAVALSTCSKYATPTELALTEGVAVDFVYLNTAVEALQDAIVNFPSSDGLELLDPELVHMNTELLFLNEFLGVLSANIEWTRLIAQDLAKLHELQRLMDTKPVQEQQPAKRQRFDSSVDSVEEDVLDLLLFSDYSDEEEPLFQEEEEEEAGYFQEEKDETYLPDDFQQGLMMMKLVSRTVTC
jgi:hypothetical protein